MHFLNQEGSPAGKTSGVVIMRELTEVEVACLPKDLPEFIALDLADLAVGDTIHLSALKLPEGVEIPALKFGEDHDIAVVVARFAKEEVDETPETDEVEATKVEGKTPASDDGDAKK